MGQNDQNGLERRVLFVDDNPDYRDAAGMRLRRAGYAVDFAEYGEDAVRMVLENPGYGLVLMDTQLPKMQGPDAVKEIRKHYDREELPILAHSDLKDEDYLMRLWEGAGQNGFLKKTDLTGRDAAEKIVPYFSQREY